MKKIITIIAVLFYILGYTQETIIPLENFNHNYLSNSNTTYYFKDVNNKLDTFVGVWKHETSTELFEITFYKVSHDHLSGDYFDRLNSKYKYVKNGVTIIDTYGANSLGASNVSGGLFESTRTLDLYYSEPGTLRKWSARVLVEYNTPSSLGVPPTLNWKIETLDRINIGGVEVSPYKVPSNLILTKQ
ncbi:hypothetical protein OAX11_05155 [Flavobacteriaceae bacterium]|nr:hypothetical protein [Flavobacteriaceae bacterium]